MGNDTECTNLEGMCEYELRRMPKDLTVEQEVRYLDTVGQILGLRYCRTQCPDRKPRDCRGGIYLVMDTYKVQ